MSRGQNKRYKKYLEEKERQRFWGGVPAKTECGTTDLTPYNAARGTAYVSGTNYDFGKVIAKRT